MRHLLDYTTLHPGFNIRQGPNLHFQLHPIWAMNVTALTVLYTLAVTGKKIRLCQINKRGYYELPFLHMILQHIPNALTMIRLVLIAPFLVFIYQQEYTNAFYTFILAGFTDGLDGWLARHFHWQSLFGSFTDPMADKLLIAASFISLAIIGKLPWWLVILVFLRDLTISFGVLAWYWFIQRKLDFKPTVLSKVNTVLQLSLLTLCLFELAFSTFAPHLLEALILLTTITTASTYVDYVWTWGKRACTNTHLAK